jgi:hypothetical protein
MLSGERLSDLKVGGFNFYSNFVLQRVRFRDSIATLSYPSSSPPLTEHGSQI